MLLIGICQNFHYVSLNLGVGTFIEPVDNHKPTRSRFIEKPCIYQRLKRFNNQIFELNCERLGEDEWVAFDSSENGVSNVRKV